MNLVQIQERLKDAPVQAIMQYANGGNPMVPPYLALAELKRRESINQSAQSQQAMQQGQDPSVKEQIEKSAGLAALQQQMQQQGMQNLIAQARPQGIPQNVPQPSRQPESEGISGLPAGDFNFADGGIVAFAGPQGSYVEGNPDAANARYQAARERLMRYGLKQQKADPTGFAAAKQEMQQAEAALSQAKTQWEQAAVAAGLDRPITNRSDIGLASRFAQQSRTPTAPPASDDSYASAEAARARARQQYVGTPTPQAAATSTPEQYATADFELVGGPGAYAQAMREIGMIPNPQDRAAAMAALQRTAPATVDTATPATSVSGIAALPGADEAQKMVLEQMRAKPDLSQAAEEYRKAQGLFGLTQPYGEERMKRAQAMEAARQQELESRGLERLMRVMGGIGARGLQGASPAYLQAVGEERAADAAFRKQMDELMGGVEEKRRAEATTGMTEAQKRVQEERKSAQEAAGKIVDADTKFKLQELQQKAVLGRLSAEEEYIRGEILKGRKYPEIIEELARAKGATRTEAEAQKAQLRREAEWNEISGDYVRRQEMAKLGVRTLEDYLRYVQRSSGGAGKSSTVASGIPPIPAGAVRLKGAQ